MAASDLKDFGNNIGLLYATDDPGTTFYITGVDNNAVGVNLIKTDALNRASVGYAVSSQGAYEFTAIAANDTVLTFKINGVDQFDPLSPVAVLLGDLTGAATLLAAAINVYTPPSGANYTAYVVGAKVYCIAAPSFGSTLNGDIVLLTQSLGNISGTTTNVENGADGSEDISAINGRRYWMNADISAVTGSIVGAVEITPYVVMKGVQAQTAQESHTIATSSITLGDRRDRLTVVDLGAGGATNLDTILGEPAIHDILVLKNTSAFTITPRDLSLSSGNIVLSPTSFAMVDDNYFLTLMYVNDATDGLVWKELWRTPQTVGANSITQTELALLSVGTPELQALAVTAAKIAANTITQGQMAPLSIGTLELIAASVTQAKLGLLSVGTPQLILLSVDSTILAPDAVITSKILDGNVTVLKLETSLQTEVIVVPVSFEEAAVMGLMKVTLPYDCTVVQIDAAVVKVIIAGDDATIIPKDHGGAVMTAGQIDLTAAAPTGNIFSSTPTGNNTFLAGEVLSLETSKVTPGGIALVSVEILRT